jgi:uncharacterized protein
MTRTGEVQRSAERAQPRAVQQPYLERLVINVTHDCNLRCSYCYADTGAYGAKRMILSEKTGEEIVDDFFARFRQIGQIQFFGGEPFLNIDGIESLCEHVTNICRRENVTRPAFTMSSNGTILNDRIVDIINRYHISITVSLDGARLINDSQRKYASGAGSYERVIKNIAILKERTGQPAQIEGTYTARHVEMDFSLVEFMKFIATELDVHYLHMPWILGNAYQGTGIEPTEKNIDHLISVYRAANVESLRSLQTPELEETIVLSAVGRALERAQTANAQQRRHICPAGSGTLSVGADGKIFPCFMFTNKAQFEFGHIGSVDDGEFERRRAAFVNRLELPAGEVGTRFESGSACAGQNFEMGGEIDYISAANRNVQAAVDTHLQEKVASLKSDSDLWDWIQIKLMLNRLAMSRDGAPKAGC